jgi:hypothetical protein
MKLQVHAEGSRQYYDVGSEPGPNLFAIRHIGVCYLVRLVRPAPLLKPAFASSRESFWTEQAFAVTWPIMPQTTKRPPRRVRRIFFNQRRRIERQRERIASLERDGSPDLVIDQVRIFCEMEQMIGQMEVHHAAVPEEPYKSEERAIKWRD